MGQVQEATPSSLAADRFVALVAVLLVAVLLPLAVLAVPVAVNARLEGGCVRDQRDNGLKAAGWVDDRSSWLPLNWSCTVEHFDGSTATYQPVPVVASVALAALAIAAVASAAWLVRRAWATRPIVT